MAVSIRINDVCLISTEGGCL